MSQTWVDDTYESTNQYGSDLTSIKNNFACLKSLFSGPSAPANLVAGMVWYDTTSGNPTKIRNKANSVWLGIMIADSSHKLWVYRNDAPEGWAIDSSVTDRVLAIKGGGGNYNVNGGQMAGSWVPPDHNLSIANVPAHDHGSAGAHQHSLLEVIVGYQGGAYITIDLVGVFSEAHREYTTNHIQSGGAHTHTSVGSGTPVTHSWGTWRPAAAVGTLQYLNI